MQSTEYKCAVQGTNNEGTEGDTLGFHPHLKQNVSVLVVMCVVLYVRADVSAADL